MLKLAYQCLHFWLFHYYLMHLDSNPLVYHLITIFLLSPRSWPLAVVGKLIPVPKMPIEEYCMRCCGKKQKGSTSFGSLYYYFSSSSVIIIHDIWDKLVFLCCRWWRDREARRLSCLILLLYSVKVETNTAHTRNWDACRCFVIMVKCLQSHFLFFWLLLTDILECYMCVCVCIYI